MDRTRTGSPFRPGSRSCRPAAAAACLPSPLASPVTATPPLQSPPLTSPFLSLVSFLSVRPPPSASLSVPSCFPRWIPPSNAADPIVSFLGLLAFPVSTSVFPISRSRTHNSSEHSFLLPRPRRSAASITAPLPSSAFHPRTPPSGATSPVRRPSRSTADLPHSRRLRICDTVRHRRRNRRAPPPLSHSFRFAATVAASLGSTQPSSVSSFPDLRLPTVAIQIRRVHPPAIIVWLQVRRHSLLFASPFQIHTTATPIDSPAARRQVLSTSPLLRLSHFCRPDLVVQRR